MCDNCTCSDTGLRQQRWDDMKPLEKKESQPWIQESDPWHPHPTTLFPAYLQPFWKGSRVVISVGQEATGFSTPPILHAYLLLTIPRAHPPCSLVSGSKFERSHLLLHSFIPPLAHPFTLTFPAFLSV